MYKLVFGLVLLGAVVIGAGCYFGYLHFSEQSADGKTSITLTVDQKKLQADQKKVETTVRDTVHPSKE